MVDQQKSRSKFKSTAHLQPRGGPLQAYTPKITGKLLNAVNLAFTITMISRILLKKYQTLYQCPNMGVWALKTLFKVQK